jgi:lysozyme
MSFDMNKLRQRLIDKEGLRLSAYTDGESYLTIGVGHLIDERKGGKITLDTAYYILDKDIQEKIADLDNHLPWWKDLDDVRQRIMIELCFNLGINGLLGFHNTLDCIRGGHWEEAGAHLLDSRAAKQTGHRYNELAQMLISGQDI